MSVPSTFRMELQRQSDHPPILTNHGDCLYLYPFEEWRVFEESISDPFEVDPDAQRFARFMISNAVDAPIDNQGRILIPPFLRERADLGRDVSILGVGQRIEIWDSERLEADLAGTQGRFNEISRDLEPKLRDFRKKPISGGR